jgi:hypothetical protein
LANDALAISLRFSIGLFGVLVLWLSIKKILNKILVGRSMSLHVCQDAAHKSVIGWLENKREEDYVNDSKSSGWNGAGLWLLGAEGLRKFDGRLGGEPSEIQSV